MDSAEKQPLGQWLEHLRKSYTPHISMRAAAEIAGLSEARWRQIENGYRVAAKDLRVPVVPPDETIVQMAEGLAGSPEELRAIGYGRAADMLAIRQERMFGDIERTSEMADQLVQMPDELLAAEVVRRILERNPRFEGKSYGPALTTSLLRDTLVQRYLRSPEDIAEDIRRLKAHGPETSPDSAGERERKRVVAEIARSRHPGADPSADVTPEEDELGEAAYGEETKLPPPARQRDDPNRGEESQVPPDER